MSASCQAAEQRHLAPRVGDVDRPDQVRIVVCQHGLVRVEIAADRLPAAEPKEIEQQPSDQRFSHARMARRDDTEMRKRRHFRDDRPNPRAGSPTLEWNRSPL